MNYSVLKKLLLSKRGFNLETNNIGKIQDGKIQDGIKEPVPVTRGKCFSKKIKTSIWSRVSLSMLYISIYISPPT